VQHPISTSWRAGYSQCFPAAETIIGFKAELIQSLSGSAFPLDIFFYLTFAEKVELK